MGATAILSNGYMWECHEYGRPARGVRQKSVAVVWRRSLAKKLGVVEWLFRTKFL